MVCWCLGCQAPQYLDDPAVQPETHPEFSARTTSLNTYVSLAFAIAGPSAWNRLADPVHNANASKAVFKRLIKTVIFTRYLLILHIREFQWWWAILIYALILMWNLPHVILCSSGFLLMSNLSFRLFVLMLQLIEENLSGWCDEPRWKTSIRRPVFIGRHWCSMESWFLRMPRNAEPVCHSVAEAELTWRVNDFTECSMIVLTGIFCSKLVDHFQYGLMYQRICCSIMT